LFVLCLGRPALAVHLHRPRNCTKQRLEQRRPCHRPVRALQVVRQGISVGFATAAKQVARCSHPLCVRVCVQQVIRRALMLMWELQRRGRWCGAYSFAHGANIPAVCRCAKKGPPVVARPVIRAVVAPRCRFRKSDTTDCTPQYLHLLPLLSVCAVQMLSHRSAAATHLREGEGKREEGSRPAVGVVQKRAPTHLSTNTFTSSVYDPVGTGKCCGVVSYSSSSEPCSSSGCKLESRSQFAAASDLGSLKCNLRARGYHSHM
jgi:hypothetical protein